MTSTRGRTSRLVFAAVTWLSLIGVAAARTIDCNAADVQCLIAAINDANANGHAHNSIRLSPGTYTLTTADNDTDGPNGLPSITSTLTIEVKGKGTATIARASDTNESFRLLHVAPTGNLTLDEITLTNGSPGRAQNGGAVFNNGGVVTLRRSALLSNLASYDGGALFNACGTVTIIASTVADNHATSGTGGLHTDACGAMTIVDSLVSGNNSTDFNVGGIVSGGGILRIAGSRVSHNGSAGIGGIFISSGVVAVIDSTTISENGSEYTGAMSIGPAASVILTNSAILTNTSNHYGSPAGILNFGTLAVTNSTFAQNRVFSLTGPPDVGIAIANHGTLSLLNSTLAENTGRDLISARRYDAIFTTEDASTTLQNTIITHGPGAANVGDCGGPVTSLGNNLVEDPSTCAMTLQSGDLTGDAGLETLADDGSAGNAHYPLLSTSQAIGGGNDAACPSRDQIGERRRGGCDIGAVEFNPRPN